MLKDFVSELRNYNFYEEFRKDYYIDAYDEHRWKVGRIRNITKTGYRTTVAVHFDGYSVRFDEVRISPSRIMTCPPAISWLPFAPSLSPTLVTQTWSHDGRLLTSPRWDTSSRSCRR